MAQFTPESPKIFAASSPIDLPQSQETTWCQRCGAARCTNSHYGRVLQPHPLGTHRFAEQNMATPIEGCDMRPEDPLKFYRFLQMIGLAPLADAWLAEVRTGIAPENIIFQSSELKVIQIIADTPQTAKKTGDDPNGHKKGDRSEGHLVEALGSASDFPWISGVAVAPPNQPKYDAQLIIDPEHPLGEMLHKVKRIGSSGMIQVDAKSSFDGVFRYYEEATRARNKHAKVDTVRNGYWAVNTNDELSSDLLYTQIVILILITLGLFNQRGHWDKVLEHCNQNVSGSFLGQESLVKKYNRFFYAK